MNDPDTPAGLPRTLVYLHRSLGAAALVCTFSTVVFRVEGNRIVWMMWRDDPVLAMILLMLGILSAIGWVVTAVRIRGKKLPVPLSSSSGAPGRIEAPYNIWKKMELSTRVWFAAAVFLTFSIIGPISFLMQGTLQVFTFTSILLKTLASGGMAASFILFGRKKILLLISFASFFALSVMTDAKTERGARRDLAADAPLTLSQEEHRDIADQRAVLGIASIFMLGAGYALWIVVLNREGNKRVRYQAEVGVAQDIQRKLLPSDIFRNSWCEAYGMTVPAADVGGDYFDIIPVTDHQVVVVVADVAGHGLGAGILSTMTKSALRSQLMHDNSPLAVLQNLNGVIHQVSERKTFVTLAYVLLDWKKRIARIATAGHHPVLCLRHNSDAAQNLRTASVALGMQETPVFSELSLPIAPGDAFLLYTDGVTEAANDRNQQYGAEKLEAHIATNPPSSAEAMTLRVMQAVREFSGIKATADDATVVSIILRQDNDEGASSHID